MIREKDIEGYLARQVVRAGGISYKWTSSVVGVPDRIVILGDEVLFVELKAPGKKPTTIQQRVHEDLRQHGATVYVIDSAEGVDNFIAERAL